MVSQSAGRELRSCPVLRTADLISGKWTLLVLRDLAKGIDRFSRLERSLAGISPKTLSERLRSLERAGVVTRTVYSEVPPRVEYALTPMGQDLIPLIEHMREWGTRWLSTGDAASPETPGRSTGGG